jgi:hypothetical protein
VRRAAFIPKHWAAYLNAFADIREHYVVVPACTFEEVMSMTLYDNSEFTYRGQTLAAHQWRPAAEAGIHTVSDLWHEGEQRFRTHTELRILGSRMQVLLRSMPRQWLRLLQTGRTDIGRDEWALHTGAIDDAVPFDGSALVRTTSDADRMGAVVIVTVYTQLRTRGWAAHATKAVLRARLWRATVEDGPRMTGGQCVWTLVGLTERAYAASRTRLRRRGRQPTCMSRYSVRTGCQCLRGPSRPTDELQRATTMMGYSGDNRRTFLCIRRATWAPEARDFIWDLAAGALPTGRGAGLPSSDCLVCEGVRDDLLHVTQCRCLHTLRLWTADVMAMIGLPRTQFHLLLAQGVPQGDGADGAIRSAVATAMRRNRAYMLMHHRAMPGHERYIVNTAKRLLRDYIAMDRLFAFGAIERRQRHNKHYESRPASRADFIDRWGALCDMTSYSTGWKQLANPISYQPILMPEAPAPS